LPPAGSAGRALGYRMIRIWNNDVIDNPDDVLQVLLLELEKSPVTLPSPSPSPGQARGGEGDMRSAAGSEFLERRPGFLLDLRAEAFAELAIDRREQLICLPRPAPDAERSGTGLGQPFGEYGLYIRKPASAVVSFGGSGVDDYHHAI
jgi:hypothetical protein